MRFKGLISLVLALLSILLLSWPGEAQVVEVGGVVQASSSGNPTFYVLEVKTTAGTLHQQPFGNLIFVSFTPSCHRHLKKGEYVQVRGWVSRLGPLPHLRDKGTVPPLSVIKFNTNYGNGVLFEALGSGIRWVQVDIYNTSGYKVFSGQAAGPRLLWNLLTTNGQPLANGVYLFVVTAKGYNEQTVRSSVRKLVILR